MIARSLLISLLVATPALADRIVTIPTATTSTPRPLGFDNISITPDGTQIIGTGQFLAALQGDRVYSVTIPSNPAIGVTPVQLSTANFSVTYDVEDAPVVSPDGQTILFGHNGNTPQTDTIYQMPIAGEGFANPTGLFGPDPNLVAMGAANFDPVYSADGQTIFFLNGESGFSGSVPDFFTPEFPDSFEDPDWDQLYSVPAGGGPVTAVTTAAQGDLDAGLWTVAPNGSTVVFSPDEPVVARSDRGGQTNTLVSVPASGGAATPIPFPAPAHDFAFRDKIQFTPDEQSILFLADYRVEGQVELFSLPVAGGTPTRVSGDLHFAGDVTNFEIAPGGASVAYVAGKTVGSASEVFLKDLGSAAPSVRVSDPAADNAGSGVSRTASGAVRFSPDGTQVYYLGDFEEIGANDLYVADTTPKTGGVASSYTYVGPDGGDFFDEANWQDANGNNPVGDPINVNEIDIELNLIVDGDLIGGTRTVTSATEQRVFFAAGASLEVINGATVSLTDPDPTMGFGPEWRFLDESGLRVVDSTLFAEREIRVAGSAFIQNSDIEAFDRDVRFQGDHSTVIDGGAVLAGRDIRFDNSASQIEGATLDALGTLLARFESQLVVTDSTISIDNGFGRVGDILDENAEGTTLTLRGNSDLFANSISDGVDLFLEDTALAIIRGIDFEVVVDPVTEEETDLEVPGVLVSDDGLSFITFESRGAELELLNTVANDARAFVINGLTGLSYADDPTAWNVSDWDGVSAIESLRLLADYNGDGTIDAADYTVWRDGLAADPSSRGYDFWVADFGRQTVGVPVAGVPEPTGAAIALAIGFAGIGSSPRRRRS